MMKKYNKILLVCRMKTLGDNAILTVIATELKRINPKCVIHACVNSAAADIWRMSPDVDNVISHSVQGGWKKAFPETLMIIRFWLERYDLAVAMGKDSAIGMAYLSMAKKVTGSAILKAGKFFFSDCVEKYQINFSDHVIKQHLYSLARLGLPINFSTRANLTVSEERIQAMKLKLKLPESYAVLCPRGSAFDGSKRNIPVGKIREIVTLISQKYGTVYVIGSAGQRSEIDAIFAGSERAIVNVAGQLSIAEMAALLSAANKFVTIDTGPMHIADALNVPIIALFGNEQVHFDRWKLRGPNSVCIRAEKPSNSGIDNEHVSLQEIAKYV